MTNVDKLKGVIKENRLSPEKVAEIIGIEKVQCIERSTMAAMNLLLNRQILSHKRLV